jgi:hypothetical protein
MIGFDKLLSAFEAGEIAGADFPHERHVQVTWALVQRYPRDEALRRLVDGIRDIAARAGRAGAYHETITRAWFELISGAESLDRYPELFDKGLLGRYYTPARLAEGRERWLDPDLHPLALPAPELTATPSSFSGVYGSHRCGDHTSVVGAVGLAQSTHRHPLVRRGGAYL